MTSSVETVTLHDEEIVIDGSVWWLAAFECEVACVTGDCPHSGPYGSADILPDTCSCVVEFEGPHGEVDETRRIVGQAALEVVAKFTDSLTDRAMEKHGGL